MKSLILFSITFYQHTQGSSTALCLISSRDLSEHTGPDILLILSLRNYFSKTKYLSIFINGRIIPFPHRTDITWHLNKNLNYKPWLLTKRSWKCLKLLNYLYCTLPNYRLEKCRQNLTLKHTSTRERDHQNALVRLHLPVRAGTFFRTAAKTTTEQPKYTGGFQFSRIKVTCRTISATN